MIWMHIAFNEAAREFNVRDFKKTRDRLLNFIAKCSISSGEELCDKILGRSTTHQDINDIFMEMQNENCNKEQLSFLLEDIFKTLIKEHEKTTSCFEAMV